MKILIIEDEILIKEQLQTQLSELGYDKTLHAANSEEAINIFKKNDPDFIICDIALKNSVKDGIGIAQEILTIKKVPLIFLSAYSDDSTLSKVKSIEHSNYLIKPCSTRQLYVTIDSAINQFITTEASHKSIAINDTCPLYSRTNHFFLRGNNRSYERVDVKRIAWIEAVRGGIEFNLINNNKYMLTASMSSFILQFNHPDLLRVHRSYMINKNAVTSIQEKAFIIPTDLGNKLIPCSQSYWNEIKLQFKTLKSD